MGGLRGGRLDPPVRNVRGCHPEKILEFYVAKGAFLKLEGSAVWLAGGQVHNNYMAVQVIPS
jgi:hypothetical protein